MAGLSIDFGSGCPACPGAYADAEMTTIQEPDARAALWRHPLRFSGPPGASLAGGRLADTALFAFAVVLGRDHPGVLVA